MPRTSQEYFRLAGRNIRWQLTDMLRKSSMEQGDSSSSEQLAQSTGGWTRDDDDDWARDARSKAHESGGGNQSRKRSFSQVAM